MLDANSGRIQVKQTLDIRGKADPASEILLLEKKEAKEERHSGLEVFCIFKHFDQELSCLI